MIFTAGMKRYANKIIDQLDPKGNYIKNVLTREHCLLVRNKEFIKDLRIISNFSLERSLIVDNKMISFAYQKNNGIPILPFVGNPEDQELKYILPRLNHLAKHNHIPLQLEQSYNYDEFSEADFNNLGID